MKKLLSNRFLPFHFVILLNACLCFSAIAANNSPASQHNKLRYSLGLAIAADNLSFKETSKGIIYNQESGTLLSNRLALTVEQNAWRVRSYVNHTKGDLDYVGRTQQGREITTTTDYSENAVELFFDHALPFINNQKKNDLGKLSSIVGVSYNSKVRNILSKEEVLGLNEHYKTLSYNIGLAWQYHSALSATYTLRAWYQYSNKAELAVDFLNQLDDSNLSLNKVSGYNLELNSTLNLSQKLTLDIFVLFHNSRIEKSDSAPLYIDGIKVGSFFQPQRDLSVKRLGLQLNYSL